MGKKEGKKAARSWPAGELWRRLGRGCNAASAASIDTTGSQPQVVVVTCPRLGCSSRCVSLPVTVSYFNVLMRTLSHCVNGAAHHAYDTTPSKMPSNSHGQGRSRHPWSYHICAKYSYFRVAAHAEDLFRDISEINNNKH